MNRRNYLKALAWRTNLQIHCYSPGDGVTRYAFFPGDYKGTYFGPSNPIATRVGLSDAITWLEGYECGRMG